MTAIRTRIGRWSLLVAVPIIMALSGCAPSGATAELQGEWRLVAIAGPDGVLAAPPTAVVMTVDGDSLRGEGPCNIYSGTVTGGPDGSAEPRAISVSPLTSTERACLDAALMDLEAQYYATLTASQTAQLIDGTLTLVGTGAVLAYERAQG